MPTVSRLLRIGQAQVSEDSCMGRRRADECKQVMFDVKAAVTRRIDMPLPGQYSFLIHHSFVANHFSLKHAEDALKAYSAACGLSTLQDGTNVALGENRRVREW